MVLNALSTARAISGAGRGRGRRGIRLGRGRSSGSCRTCCDRVVDARGQAVFGAAEGCVGRVARESRRCRRSRSAPCSAGVCRHWRQMALGDCDRVRQAVFDLPRADARAAEDRTGIDTAVVAEDAGGSLGADHAGHQLDAGVGRVIGQRGDGRTTGGASLLSKLRSAAALRRLGQAYVSIGVRMACLFVGSSTRAFESQLL